MAIIQPNIKNEIKELLMSDFPGDADTGQVEEKVDVIAQGLSEIIARAILNLNIVVMIPAGTVSVGSGVATVPTPVPIPCQVTKS